jgi:hypothetical protein
MSGCKEKETNMSVMIQMFRRNYEVFRGRGGGFNETRFKCGAQGNKDYECLKNIDTSKIHEGRTHIAQGVKSVFGYVVGDNIDKVQQEHGQNPMLCIALLKS